MYAIYPPMISTLSQAHELIAQKDAHILKLTEKLQSTQRQLTTLQCQVEQLLKRLYGRKSEKLNPGHRFRATADESPNSAGKTRCT